MNESIGEITGNLSGGILEIKRLQIIEALALPNGGFAAVVAGDVDLHAE